MPDETVIADFKVLGVEDFPPEWQTEELVEEGFDVWKANWKSVVAFLKLETQWRVAGTAGGLVWLGLDYAAAHAVLGKSFRRLLPDLRVMEVEACAIMNAGDG